ncbi:MAG: DNA-binding protein WhiA [Clostridia bacterium]|nr:DNA-binding protein WhiA [Clostridia bacterium]
MSFSSETKSALAKINPQNECCARAQLFAMLVFGAEMSDEQVVFNTENEDTAYICSGLMLRCFDIISAPLEHRRQKNGNVVFKTTIADDDCKTLIDFVRSFESMETAVICPHCFESFLRGAFISCGFVNPPDKSYDVEFKISSPDTAVDFALILSKHIKMPMISTRKGDQIVYFRDGGAVADMLTIMGAKKSAFDIMNSQALRSIRNAQNRQTNIEIANISKTAATAAAQIEAVEWIEKNGKAELLSPMLAVTAKMRVDNPTLSLSELGAMFDPPVSKSQMSKRLQKIVDIYNSRKNDEKEQN